MRSCGAMSEISPENSELLVALCVVVSLAQLLVAAIVGFAAIQFYRWQKATKERESYAGAIKGYHNLNLLVIGNPDIQEVERVNHFVSSDLSRGDVIKMFYYFE